MNEHEYMLDDLAGAHEGHRLLDVTAIGHLHPHRLCLDCKMEFEERPPAADRAWISAMM